MQIQLNPPTFPTLALWTKNRLLTHTPAVEKTSVTCQMNIVGLVE